ncbi:MAG: hypothetical protein AAB544_00080, partial [Patescibacteria group bacterium]
MIPLDPHSHRAEILPDGTIVIPEVSSQSMPQHIEKETVQPEPEMLWMETEPVKVEAPVEPKATPKNAPKIRADQAIAYLKAGQLSAYKAAVNVISESKDQYVTSARDLRSVWSQGRGKLRSTGSVTWTFLTQPVWIVSKNKTPKQYSRGTLFVLDTVRFGGTFAALFAALFLSLNYQSFWAIVGSQIRPIQAAQSTNALVTSVDEALREKLMKSPSLAVSGNIAGDLLSYLPDVGPPENRIIIPKLNLNIPLVTPSYQNLLS